MPVEGPVALRNLGRGRRRIEFETVSRPEVMPITAIPADSFHTRLMERLVDEAEYVLAVLHRMRNEVSANPNLFDEDARQ